MKSASIITPPSIDRQVRLPIFPSEGIMLGEQIPVIERGDVVWYFNYNIPIFSHASDDHASFRMYTSSLCDMAL